jgi:hypothetical protein
MNKFNERFLMKNISLFGIFIFVISGCASVPIPLLTLDKGAENVVVRKADPGDNFKVIGPVSGIDGYACGGYGFMGTYERAVTKLRNNTFKMGGDYVQIINLTEPVLRGNCRVNEFSIRGTAYKKISNNPNPLPIIDVGEENLTKKLREISKLNKDGILTDEEYKQQKDKLLKRGF